MERELLEVRSSQLSTGQYRYSLVTREPDGGKRPRTFKAQGFLPLDIGRRVSLLLDGPRVAGVGEESSNLWAVIQTPIPTKLGLARFIGYLNKVCLLICGLLAIRWVLSFDSPGMSVWIWVMVLIALIALIPLASSAAIGRKPIELQQVDTLAEITGETPRVGERADRG